MINLPLTSSTIAHSFRLNPSQDLKKELLYYAQVHHLRASTILSAVGSLKHAGLRLADRKQITKFLGPFEILSLTGTVHRDGIHLHASISDNEGRVLGGHLMEGCEIYTTSEIILLENTELIFSREFDEHTGYNELKILPRS